MKQRVFKFVCIVLLLCSVLIVLPACAADFEESYLPITSIAETDITVGMATDDFYSLLEPLEDNQDYVHYLNQYYFLRSASGKSMLIETDKELNGKIVNVYIYDVSNLATKQDFRQLREGMTVPQAVEQVGLPKYVEYRISAYQRMDFPVADGSTCHLIFRPLTNDLGAEVVLKSVSFS